MPETSLNEKIDTENKCDLHPSEFLPCCVCDEHKEYRKQNEIRRKEKEKQMIESRFESIGLGDRYKKCSFENYKASCECASEIMLMCLRYAETFRERRRDGDCLALLGNLGTGKNHLAAAICRVVHSAGYTVVHTTTMRMIRYVRRAYQSSDISEQDQIDSLVVPDLLVLDEIGVNRGTDDELVLLSDVICSRIENYKPVILVSNLSLTDLAKYVGDRVIDRLYDGNSNVLCFTWESYRRRDRQE